MKNVNNTVYCLKRVVVFGYSFDLKNREENIIKYRLIVSIFSSNNRMKTFIYKKENVCKIVYEHVSWVKQNINTLSSSSARLSLIYVHFMSIHDYVSFVIDVIELMLQFVSYFRQYRKYI